MTFKKNLNMRLEFKGRCMYLIFPKEMYPKFPHHPGNVP